MSVSTFKKSLFLLDVAGHIGTRRGPDLARGPDVVHHCIRLSDNDACQMHSTMIYITCIDTCVAYMLRLILCAIIHRSTASADESQHPSTSSNGSSFSFFDPLRVYRLILLFP